MQYDLIVVGGGPAGLCCALYGSRAGLKVLLLERFFAGGQMITTPEISNYPGFEPGSGADLAMAMEKSAQRYGAEIKNEEATALRLTDEIKTIVTATGEYQAKAVVLCNGASRRQLDVPGEMQFMGRGVSYCATCDGNLYRGGVVAVIGGGNTALEDALYLSGLCKEVVLVHRRDQFRGEALLAKQVMAAPNITKKLGYVVSDVAGDTKVRSITLKSVTDGTTQQVLVDGVFVAIGTKPATDLLQGQVALSADGFVKAGEDCKTNLPGVFVAGDLRSKPLRQVVTAVADGAVAAASAGQYLREI